MKIGPNQQAWIDALRSGEFSQCRGQLEAEEGGHCCLGVACRVYERLTGKPADGQEHEDRLDGVSLSCYPGVTDFFRLRNSQGRPTGRALPTLTELNDKGSSFNEIADKLESNPAEYFAESL